MPAALTGDMPRQGCLASAAYRRCNTRSAGNFLVTVSEGPDIVSSYVHDSGSGPPVTVASPAGSRDRPLSTTISNHCLAVCHQGPADKSKVGLYRLSDHAIRNNRPAGERSLPVARRHFDTCRQTLNDRTACPCQNRGDHDVAKALPSFLAVARVEEISWDSYAWATVEASS